jgi:hypothetical protein
MQALELLALFLAPLERSGMVYCVTGSVAASIYGEPRLTADIDLVVVLSKQDITALRLAFAETEYYVPPLETLQLEIARSARGMFNLIHHASQFKADFYVAGRDPLHKWALEHRRRIQLDSGQSWLAPPEYVILRKLEFFREGEQDKHLRDVRFMLATTPIDHAFVAAQAARLGVADQWQQAQQP